MEVFQSGLIKDKQYPYLGASPDRIQVCNCCAKTLLEVTSNSTLQQLIALMKWLPNTKSKEKRLGTIKGKDN